MDNMQRPVGLMAVVLGLALYLNLTWLAMLVGAGAVFMVLSTVQLHKPVPVAQAAPKKEEEILSPVIVQDVGEAPYLYPPDFRLKVKPDWEANNMFENFAWGLGKMSAGIGAITMGRHLARGKWK